MVESMNVLGDDGVAVASIVEFSLSRKVAPTSKCLMCYVMLILRFDSCLGGDAGVHPPPPHGCHLQQAETQEATAFFSNLFLSVVNGLSAISSRPTPI